MRAEDSERSPVDLRMPTASVVGEIYRALVSDEEGLGPDQLAPLAPYPTLAERDAGQLPEPEFYEGVPAHMERHLRTWVSDALTRQEDLVRKVITRCRIAWTAFSTDRMMRTSLLSPAAVLGRVMEGRLEGITSTRPIDRLTVLDAIINLHPDWDIERDGWDNSEYTKEWVTSLVDLNDLLQDCGSAWYVNGEFRGLCRRVDPTATDAWKRARQAAEQANRERASDYLARAWNAVYGQHPDPSAGYSAAVKAVEAAVLPVVYPDRKAQGKTPTVHQARRQLHNCPEQWRLVLAESDRVAPGEGSVEVVASMLDRLLRGETERHADDDNRPSRQEEAEAALHLAVLLVQWFVTGAVQPRN